MSSYFEVQEKEVPIDDENKVVIRKLSYGQRNRTISRASKVNPLTQEANIDLAVLRTEQLFLGVVSWTGPNFAGREPSRENIEALPEDIATIIETGLDNFDKPLDDEEKKG